MPERRRTPFAASAATQKRMSLLARRDTVPELALLRELHRLGLRYFVHPRPLSDLRREADLVFRRSRIAVFVDGCFWHGCVDHGRRVHQTNDWYWPARIERNHQRDPRYRRKAPSRRMGARKGVGARNAVEEAGRLAALVRTRRNDLALSNQC